jgi:diguanylate cyclase (GGDEF)-like protein/PAS domain S-box-containing protein
MAQKNILLIQDDPTDATAVRSALNGSFQVEWLKSCSAGLERIAQERKRPTLGIEAVLLDLFLPDCRGVEAFDRVYHNAPQIPILVLAAAQDEDIAKVAVQRGAQDYLLKHHLDEYLLSKALSSMIERAAITEALFNEKERAQVMLNSIADAVMSADVGTRVTYLNVVAEGLIGWSRKEATGRPVAEVFRIIDATTREPAQNPMALAMRENKGVVLTPNCILVRRDGVETPIEDSTAPIHDRSGQVTGAVMVFHDVSTSRAQSRKMLHLAQHDSLTDLPNRALFSARLTEAIVAAHRYRRKLAVLFVDIDRFKHINDSLGHAIADRVLQSVAGRLQSCVRASDTVSRQGGDEFVILLSEVVRAQHAGVSADKMLRAVHTLHRIDHYDLHLTASIGIATYPDDGTEAETLMKNADFAMYHAKDCGRNNYQFFKPDMNLLAVERQSLEVDLRVALENREFELHYQPKVSLETGAITAVEALIRWHHPQRGLVSPTEFIPVAEDCGVIVPIGRWVLREACRQTRAWREAGLPPVRIAINVSPRELREENFVATVRAILTEAGLEPCYLELELTETFLMQDEIGTAAVLQALRDVGVTLALDDFGTGYSSLSHLQRFPIDTLKIDQSFVRDITTDANDANIVSAVISMGQSLHMRVVAEGVETQDQVVFLQERGCPEAQGYYFCRPVVADQLTRLLGGSLAKTAGALNRLGEAFDAPGAVGGTHL